MAEPDFNVVAAPYRWLEYLTLGRALERTRGYFVLQLQLAKSALVLGDGDGRFVAEFLASNTKVRVEAIDSSFKMLQLLTERCEQYEGRLTTHHGDALDFHPSRTYDLICTHFFLDCLTQSQLDRLVERLLPALEDDGRWLVSDFRVPSTGWLHWPARIFIRTLYFAFRILTGLRVTHLPDHASVFAAHGLMLKDRHLSLGGVLTTELWQIKLP